MPLVKIRYNGRRFPRTINLRSHKTKVFHPQGRELEFDEYDANLMLRNNIRIGLDSWEFSVVGVSETDNLKAVDDEFISPATVVTSKEKPKKSKSKK